MVCSLSFFCLDFSSLSHTLHLVFIIFIFHAGIVHDRHQNQQRAHAPLVDATAANQARPVAANQANPGATNQTPPGAPYHANAGAAKQVTPGAANQANYGAADSKQARPTPSHLALYAADEAPAARAPTVGARRPANRANTANHLAQAIQANATADNIGNPIMIPVGAPQIGHRRNPQHVDQVDGLDLMSPQMSDGMTQLCDLVHGLQPTRSKIVRTQIQDSLDKAIVRRQAMVGGGMSTISINNLIDHLERKLNDILLEIIGK